MAAKSAKSTPAARAQAGYSGTPLAKKLGIKTGCRLWALAAPKHYSMLLEPLPPNVVTVDKPNADVDVAHLFVTRRSDMQKQLKALRGTLSPQTALWVSWPKKASKVVTDLTENTIRDAALPLGFVDVKVCAVDQVWSGLKLVVRKQLRQL
jgi:hypothetical protein